MNSTGDKISANSVIKFFFNPITIGIYTIWGVFLYSYIFRDGFGMEGGDVRDIFSAHEYLRGQLTSYKFPAFWQPYTTNGQPFLEFSMGMLYPPNYFFLFLFPTKLALTLNILSHLILAYIGCYLYMGCLKKDRLIQAAMALTYVFSGYVACRFRVSHLSLIFTYCYIPLTLYYLHKLSIKSKNYLKSPEVALGIIGGLQLSVSFPQNAVYQGLFYFAYFLLIYPPQKVHFQIYKRMWIVVLSCLLISLPTILSAIQLSQISDRVFGLQHHQLFAGSMPINQLIQFLFPFYFSKGYVSMHESSFYIGPIFLIVILHYLILRFSEWKQSRIFIFAVALSIVVLIYSFGKHLSINHVILDIPVLKMFRYPVRAFVIMPMLLIILMYFSLTSEKLKVSKAISVMALLLLGVFCSYLAKEVYRGTRWVGVYEFAKVFPFIAAGLILVFYKLPNRKSLALISALSGVIFFLKVQGFEKEENIISEINQPLLTATRENCKSGSVLTVFPSIKSADVISRRSMMFQVQALAGQATPPTQWLRRLHMTYHFRNMASRYNGWGMSGIEFNGRNITNPVFSILGVECFFTSDRFIHKIWNGIERLYQEGNNSLIKNRNYLGRVIFLNKKTTLPADQQVYEMIEDNVDIINRNDLARADIIPYKIDGSKIHLNAENTDAVKAVVNFSYYPWAKVAIDTHPVVAKRCFVNSLCFDVPANSNSIIVDYKNNWIVTTLKVSLVFFMIYFVLVLLSICQYIPGVNRKAIKN